MDYWTLVIFTIEVKIIYYNNNLDSVLHEYYESLSRDYFFYFFYFLHEMHENDVQSSFVVIVIHGGSGSYILPHRFRAHKH